MLRKQRFAFALLAAATAFTAVLSVPTSAQANPVAGASPAGAKRTLIRAGHVLDVKSGKLADGQTIVIVGETIQSIAPSGSVAAQRDDTVIDLANMTVLPGLIDVHTHLTMNPDFDPYRELTTTNAKEAINGVVNARTTLLAGFTSVRNVGAGGLCGRGPARCHQLRPDPGPAHDGQRSRPGDYGRPLRRQSFAL